MKPCSIVLAGLLAIPGTLVPAVGQSGERIVFEDSKAGRCELPDRLPCAAWGGDGKPWCLYRRVSDSGVELVLTLVQAVQARLPDCRRGGLMQGAGGDVLHLVWESASSTQPGVIHYRRFDCARRNWVGEAVVMTGQPPAALEGMTLADDGTVVALTRKGEDGLHMNLLRPGQSAWESPISIVERTPVKQVAIGADHGRVAVGYATADGLMFVRRYHLANGGFEDAVGVPVGDVAPYRCDVGQPIDIVVSEDMVYLAYVQVGSASETRIASSDCSDGLVWRSAILPDQSIPTGVRLVPAGGGRAIMVGLLGESHGRLGVWKVDPGVVLYVGARGEVAGAFRGVGVGHHASGLPAVAAVSRPPSGSPLRGHVIVAPDVWGKGRGVPWRDSARDPRLSSIEDALGWLRRHQDEDGRWDADGFMKHDAPGTQSDGPGNAVHDIGVTGLAMLCFLGDGGRIDINPHRDVLRRATRWLVGNQQESGLLGTNAAQAFIYDHAIATLALCRAYGQSSAPALQAPAQKAINYLELHRNPYSVWRYQSRDNDNDTSITTWCIMSYEAAEFHGLKINRSAEDLCVAWLDQVADRNGRHGYAQQGQPTFSKSAEIARRFPSDRVESMTAAALCARFALGQDPKLQPTMNRAADLVMAKPPLWDVRSGSIDFCYWLFGARAMYEFGGRHWAEWSARLLLAVRKSQHGDKSKPNLLGSWDPIDAWGEDGGRVYSTALLCLTLQYDVGLAVPLRR